jgi:hypothetical protein
MDSEVNRLRTGDVAAQLNVGLDNIEASLKSVRYALADLVRLNIDTTDISLCL